MSVSCTVSEYYRLFTKISRSHQSRRSSVFLQAEWIPMLADCTSASMLLSQVAD